MWFLAALSALFSIGEGIAANDAAQKEAQAQKDQAALKLKESETLAYQKGIEGEQFKANQALAYLASGVTLEGSPLSVLEETQYKTKLETDSILTRAKNQYSLDINKAENLQRQGTGAIFGGIVKAMSPGNMDVFSKADIFQKTKKLKDTVDTFSGGFDGTNTYS